MLDHTEDRYMTQVEKSKLIQAKYKLEDYLKMKGVKDWWAMDEKMANETMAISTFKVWCSWRMVADIVG